jgi:WD40 repeat protein
VSRWLPFLPLLTLLGCHEGTLVATGRAPFASATAVASASAGSTPTEEPQLALSPCELAAKQRERAGGLQAEGRIARAERVLAHADQLCPASQADSAPARAQLTELLRDDRTPQQLLALGMKAELERNRPEMQRMFDRAVERARVLKTPFVIEGPSPRWRPGVSFRPDGRLLAVLGREAVSLFDAQAGYREVRRLQGFGELRTLAFSPDGKLLAVGNEGTTIHLFDATNFRELKRLHHPSLKPDLSPIDTKVVLGSLAFSRDGALLASASWDGAVDGTVLLWDVKRGKPSRPLEETTFAAEVRFDSDGRLVAQCDSPSCSEAPIIWDPATGKLVGGAVDADFGRARAALARFRPQNTESIKAFAFSGDRKWLALGLGEEVLLIEVATAQGRTIDASLARRARAFAFSEDSSTLAIDGKDGVTVLDVASGRALREPLAVRVADSVLVSRDGSRLVALDGEAQVWSLEAPAKVVGLGGYVGAAALSADGKLLATVTEEGLQLGPSNESQRPLVPAADGVQALGFSADGKTLVAAGPNKAKLIDVATRQTLRELPFPVYSGQIVFAPDGQSALFGSELVDAKTWLKRASLPNGPFAFSPDSALLATARGDKLDFVDRDGKSAFVLDPAWSNVTDLCFSPSSKLAVSASDYFGPGEVQVWDLVQRREQARFGAANKAKFLSDTTLLLAGPGLSLRALDGRPLASLAAVGSGRAGFILSSEGPWVELAGEASVARAALSCRLADNFYPFEVCSDHYEVSGLAAQLVAGEANAAGSP